jgi:hypothetical protein
MLSVDQVRNESKEQNRNNRSQGGEEEKDFGLVGPSFGPNSTSPLHKVEHDQAADSHSGIDPYAIKMFNNIDTHKECRVSTRYSSHAQHHRYLTKRNGESRSSDESRYRG